MTISQDGPFPFHLLAVIGRSPSMGADVATIIRTCTVAEIEQSATLEDLLSAYEQRVAFRSSVLSVANMAAYRDMEARGAMHAVGAFSPELVGLATLLIYGLPHYAGRMVAAMESFSSCPPLAEAALASKLLRAAEQRASELGATALLVSAPVGGRLERCCLRTGFP